MNLIITKGDSFVEVFLLQKNSLGEALDLLQRDWRFAKSKTDIWEISPSSDNANAPAGGMRLRHLSSVGVNSLAQAKLNEALYYANQSPDSEEAQLNQFAAQCLTRLRELKAGKPASIAQSAALVLNEGGSENGVR